MGYCISVAIEKGGVGKTATATNLAALMARDGKKVLVVDMDAQGNSTFTLTGARVTDATFARAGVYDMFRAYGISDAGNYISHTQFEGIDIIPANANTPMTENLLPEESEVLAGEEIPAGSIAKLKAEIGKRLKKQTQSGARFGKRDKVYPVSCAMALRALQATCQEYCDRDCPYAKEEGCKGDKCPCRPFKVLFDGKYIVKL